MSANGVDFLEDWIRTNVTAADNADGHPRALALAQQCLSEAAAHGIPFEEIERGRLSVTSIILDAMVHLDEPGTPVD